MAKSHSKRLKDKYGYKGGDFQKLTERIIAVNREDISANLAKKSQEFWGKALSGVRVKEQQFTIPKISEILPKKKAFSKAGKINSKLITDNLQESIVAKMRQSLKKFEDAGKVLTVRATRNGKPRQVINPDLIKDFEGSLRKTFSSYTKRDPKLGVPANVSQIATTEMRTAINTTKDTFAKVMAEKNKDAIVMMKRWIHNSSLSKKPENVRKGHLAKDYVTIPINKKFRVKDKDGSTDSMDRPHDPDAPPSQVIGCHCDIVYLARIRQTKPKKN